MEKENFKDDIYTARNDQPTGRYNRLEVCEEQHSKNKDRTDNGHKVEEDKPTFKEDRLDASNEEQSIKK